MSGLKSDSSDINYLHSSQSSQKFSSKNLFFKLQENVFNIPINVKINFRCSSNNTLFCIIAHCTVHAVRKSTTHHREISLCTSESQNKFRIVSTCKIFQHGIQFNKTRYGKY